MLIYVKSVLQFSEVFTTLLSLRRPWVQVSYQFLLFSAEDINLQRHDLPVTKESVLFSHLSWLLQEL